MSDSKTITAPIDWQSEMNRIATKHHIIVCWVAIILDPIWFIADYFTIPDYWKIFFVVRISVALITLLGVLLRKKLNISTEALIFIPVFGISLQNAYMWSVMDVSQLQQHAFAYIALFIGAGMLVLWKPLWSIIVVVLSFIANIIFFHALSGLSTQEILINGGMLVATVAVISAVLIHTRYSLTKKEIIARLALAESNKELAQKKHIIEEKNKDITDSINYAKRIQEAILPSKELCNKLFSNAFILFQPKDIVSGDFYWFAEKNGKKLIAAVDCTGHGVPGAFMSMIGNAFLNQIVNEKGITTPAEILNQLRELIISSLKQTGAEGENKDGMDISLISMESVSAGGSEAKIMIEFAGANNPLWIIRRNEQRETKNEMETISSLPILEEIKGDKQPIGIYTGKPNPFTNHTVKINAGDSLYISTDGFSDQFGGKVGKKFRNKNMQEVLLHIQNEIMQKQQEILLSKFNDWKGILEQVDDVLVIGIRV